MTAHESSSPLAASIQWLVDREQIRMAMGRCTRGVDRVDAESIRSAYHPGSIDEHGVVAVSGDEFADQAWRSSPLRGPSHHLIGEPYIELDGDHASVETYFITHQVHFRPLADLLADPARTDADGEHLSVFAGRYLDRIERRDGEWKISRRKVVMDLAEESADRPLHPLAGHFPRSERFPDDEAYTFLAQ